VEDRRRKITGGGENVEGRGKGKIPVVLGNNTYVLRVEKAGVWGLLGMGG
jgi:hypothetical protein